MTDLPEGREASAAAQAEQGGLVHYLRPINVWALSFGCILGWGAFVMPGTQLLPTAGPGGVVIAMLISAVIIALIAANFHYLLNRRPDSGGAFAFTRRVFGHDHAFLCAWASILAYVSIMWANATAFALIARFLFGPVFQFGYLYQIAGYDVYLGEVLLTLAVLMVFGLLSLGSRKVMNALNTFLALVLIIGAAACLCLVATSQGADFSALEPAFAPGENPAMAVFSIVALAPWAFIGFESVSHASGEFSFSPKKLFGILLAAIICGTFVYIAMSIISLLGMPDRYDNWVAYLQDLGNLSGLDGLPTFHAMQMALGNAGIAFLAVVVLAAISTSLLGLYRASSRLLYAMAKEEILPPRFTQLRDGVPYVAIVCIMLVSVVVPFVGRAAIGWIVDVTTVSAAIVYGYASACALVVARDEGNRLFKVTGIIGVVAAVVFLVFPLVPNIFTVSALAPESYLILAAWAILGLILFRIVFQRDRHGVFGKSTVVWIFMLFLIFFASTMWMRQVTNTTTQGIVADTSEYYLEEYAEHGVVLSDEDLANEKEHLQQRTDEVRQMLLDNSLVQMALIIVSLVIMFSIYALMLRRQKHLDTRRAEAEQMSKAKTEFLANMSHDIRTPMNAIIGYTHLARREGTTAEEAQEYLEKIDASSMHLLGLINDILEMSRIESGKMELSLTEVDLKKILADVRDMYASQMQDKGVTYIVDTQGVRDAVVMCDAVRFDRMLLNLVSNAYKFTSKGGTVTVSLTQLGEAQDGRADYELRVKDTGIGMTEEFAGKVFEAFERERSSTVDGIQGTGLGTAITKSIVDLMGGTIRVVTALGEGTEFIVNMTFDVADAAAYKEGAGGSAGAQEKVDFASMRALVVEDNEINREIAVLILKDEGFEVEEAENGKIGLDMVAQSQPGYYDLVLMDVRMPVMDGLEATRRIRALDDAGLANIPIIIVSANAFAEETSANFEAGASACVPKPLDVPALRRTLVELLSGSTNR